MGASRYQVQERFPDWGSRGQARLARATAVVVGVGALGGNAAGLLARAGVGNIHLVDPDRPSLDNLHRQVLYDERDVARGRRKVWAAARRLIRANSGVRIQAHATSLAPDNALELLGGADVVLDGLDQGPARYLLNEACLELGIPWIHAGVVGDRGQLLVVQPGQGPCLRCWLPPPSPDIPQAQSVATLGVLPPTPACLASLQVMEALKILLGQREQLLAGLLRVELWPPRFRIIQPRPEMSRHCPACRGDYRFLKAG